MNRLCGLAICFAIAGIAAVNGQHTDMSIMLAAGAIILSRESK